MYASNPRIQRLGVGHYEFSNSLGYIRDPVRRKKKKGKRT